MAIDPYTPLAKPPISMTRDDAIDQLKTIGRNLKRAETTSQSVTEFKLKSIEAIDIVPSELEGEA